MRHGKHFTKALDEGEEALSEAVDAATGDRSSRSFLYPVLLAAGAIAAGVLATRYLQRRSRKQGATEPLAASDEFSKPVVVEGSSSVDITSRQGTQEPATERTEYFADDTASAPPPRTFSTDNPDIPTLNPERDGVEWQSSSESRPRTP